MTYVEETLTSDEEIIYEARFHWTYTFAAFAWLLILGWIGIGVIVFIFMMIRRWTTEIAVTNQRFVFKRGWIARKTEELGLNRMEEINLQQGVLGRLMGYGKLKIHGTGGENITTPDIDDPLQLRKALSDARSR